MGPLTILSSGILLLALIWSVVLLRRMRQRQFRQRARMRWPTCRPGNM